MLQAEWRNGDYPLVKILKDLSSCEHGAGMYPGDVLEGDQAASAKQHLVYNYISN